MSRPAPYPADTRAKGWRFELDYEQMEQSETWPLAAEIPMAQHALLFMWLTAWSKQVPCGSFPDDEEVIRAACRIPASTWPKLRGVLLRGWWKADDGRLYHPTLTKRVLEMRAKRRSDADRTAAKRARDAAEADAGHADVTRDTRATTAGVPPESSTDHRPKNKDISHPSGAHPPAGGLAAGFADFWVAWPKGERKQDKAKCLDHWKRNALHLKAAEILADVRVKRGTQKWAEGYIEAPLVYLRGKRWEDGVEPEAPPAAVVTVASSAAATTAAQLAEQAAHAAKAASPEAQAARLAAVARVKVAA